MSRVDRQLEIEWVNHASYIARLGDFELLTDPWLFGSVFNKGWDLVVETTQSLSDLRSIKNIWISHEHPDHFNPVFFKGYSAEQKKGVRVYFQACKDQRVARFLLREGFEVVELESGKSVVHETGVELCCFKNGIEDSWLVLKRDREVVVNLNDCIITDLSQLTAVRERFGDVTLLLTQFGYAAKVGNKCDVDMRRAESRKWRQCLVSQLKALNSTYVVPFASYKYFSHSENFYMNEGLSTPREVCDDLKQVGLSERCVVLLPGEKWRPGPKADFSQAINRYEEAWRSVKPAHFDAQSSSRKELGDLSMKWVQSLKDNCSPWLYWLLCRVPMRFCLRSIEIEVADLGETMALGPKGGLVLSNRKRDVDITLSSESLSYLFATPYGANALFVNGRFQAHSPRGTATLFTWAHLGLMKSAGIKCDFKYVMSNSVRLAQFASDMAFGPTGWRRKTHRMFKRLQFALSGSTQEVA